MLRESSGHGAQERAHIGTSVSLRTEVALVKTDGVFSSVIRESLFQFEHFVISYGEGARGYRTCRVRSENQVTSRFCTLVGPVLVRPPPSRSAAFS